MLINLQTVMTMKHKNKFKRLAPILVVMFLVFGTGLETYAQIAEGTWFVGGNLFYRNQKAENGFRVVQSNNGSVAPVFPYFFFPSFTFPTDSKTTTNNINFTNGSLEVIRTSYDLTPNIGYFVTDRFAVGIRGGYGFDQTNVKGGVDPDNPTTETFDDVKVRAHLVILDPFIRYYIPLGDDGKGGLFGSIQTPFRWGRQNLKLNDDKIKGPQLWNFSAILSASFYYFVTPNIGIEGTWAFAQYRVWTEKFTEGPMDGQKSRAREFLVGFQTVDINIGLQWYFYR